MNRNYLISEISGRWRRSLLNIGLVALIISVLVCITLLSKALERAFHAPLNDIGANITVQVSGDVPEQMAGPVLPCSVAPIQDTQSRKIAVLPGVQSMSRAVLFWDFSDDAFQIVVGLHPGDPAGPALLRTAVTEGRMLHTGEQEPVALAETLWAKNQGVTLGDQVSISKQPYTIVGLVDGSQISKIGAGHLFIPLVQAQKIVAEAKEVASVHEFGPKDANLLFIQADRDKTEDIAAAIKGLLGNKTSVSTPASFKELLGSLFSLTQRFSDLISIMVLIFALLLISRNSAAAIRERSLEIGIMKAVGWTGANIRSQVITENFFYVTLGTLLGLGGGWLALTALSSVSISIPIPWDMAPTPHFLPGGEQQLFREVRLRIHPEFGFFFLVSSVSIFLGIATAWSASRSITKLQASEVLRYE